MDLLGAALLDYQHNNYTEDIKTFSSIAEEDSLPLPYMFRDFDTMPTIEQQALKSCRGTVLDIGCGAGSHSLWLQNNGFKVTALDQSKGAIETCKLRGIKECVSKDLYQHNGKYDTLLLLMNGIGLAGKMNNLTTFFTHLKSLLNKGGQILVDSSDLIYMYMDEEGEYWVDSEKYYGEVAYSMQYKNIKGSTFPWLYIDYNSLQRACFTNNLTCELVSEGSHYDYLAKLSL